MRPSILALAVALALGMTAAQAQPALTPAQEARARALFTELRCVVCQNQSIAESDADVARDLRGIVREQIAAGRADDDVIRFLVDRYGEFVLLKPVFAWHTLLLWLAPLIAILTGGALIWRGSGRRGAGRGASSLSEDEEAALARLREEP